MNITKTSNIAKGAVCIALGVLIPQIFHLFGGGGPAFLPMHIPVLLAGFLVGPITGLYVGILTPILSHFITGMPPIAPVPMLPIMIFELAAYGFIAGVLYNKLKLNVFISLLSSMLVGRVVYGFIVYFLINFFKFNLPGPMAGPIIAVVSATKAGLIGIVIQIVVIPTLVKLLEGESINVRSSIS